jgi:hypothetical protein
MSLTDERFIDEESAKQARIQRLIEREENRIVELGAALQGQYNEATHRRWLAARNRLRNLRREIIRCVGFQL